MNKLIDALYHIMSKLFSARFIFAVSVAYVFCVVGKRAAQLTTPEMIKDFVWPFIMLVSNAVIIFYFNMKRDNGVKPNE